MRKLTSKSNKCIKLFNYRIYKIKGNLWKIWWNTR